MDMKIQENIFLLPLWLKSPSISMDDLEWAIQSMEQGTMPSWAGERSVVRTKHQSGLSWSRSRTSTVWPRRTVSSPLLPLLATKSWITTVNSQPPDSWNGIKKELMSVKTSWWFIVICFYSALSLWKSPKMTVKGPATLSQSSQAWTFCKMTSGYKWLWRTQVNKKHINIPTHYSLLAARVCCKEMCMWMMASDSFRHMWTKRHSDLSLITWVSMKRKAISGREGTRWN